MRAGGRKRSRSLPGQRPLGELVFPEAHLPRSPVSEATGRGCPGHSAPAPGVSIETENPAEPWGPPCLGAVRWASPVLTDGPEHRHLRPSENLLRPRCVPPACAPGSEHGPAGGGGLMAGPGVREGGGAALQPRNRRWVLAGAGRWVPSGSSLPPTGLPAPDLRVDGPEGWRCGAKLPDGRSPHPDPARKRTVTRERRCFRRELAPLPQVLAPSRLCTRYKPYDIGGCLTTPR